MAITLLDGEGAGGRLLQADRLLYSQQVHQTADKSISFLFLDTCITILRLYVLWWFTYGRNKDEHSPYLGDVPFVMMSRTGSSKIDLSPGNENENAEHRVSRGVEAVVVGWSGVDDEARWRRRVEMGVNEIELE